MTLLYYVLKVVVYVSLRAFHGRVSVVNKKLAAHPGPLIVVSNHPATILDPLHAVVNVRGMVFFLANASLFKYKLSAWLLNRLYCIPVERPQDVNGRPLHNEQNFARARQHLSEGGKLYVAVEGSSYVERRLRKVKTGTARIALQAEAAHDFKLGSSILPTGLNYEDPNGFRKPVLVIYDEPIRVADFQELYYKDESEAVLALTNAIAERLDKLIINTTDDEEDLLLRQMETLLQNDKPLPLYQHFLRTKEVQHKLRQQQATSPQAYAAFAKRVKDYFEKLQVLGVSDEALITPLCPIRMTLLTFGLPFALAGWLMHWPPSNTIKTLSRSLNKDIHWMSTYNYVPSLIIYPLFYWLEVEIFTHWFPGWGWAFLAGFVLLGLWWEWYRKAAGLFRQQVKILTGNREFKSAIAQAKEMRGQLLKVF
ncbi:MAG: hypothetical protein Kow0027_13120 [Saprospiraceae bacterium]